MSAPSPERSGASSASAKARAKIQAARSTASVAGRHVVGATLARDGRRLDARHAAWVDEFEVAEVRGDVQRDAVVRDAALDPQPERPDLARRRPVRVAPAPGMAVAPAGRHAVRGAGRDERGLQGAHEGTQQESSIVETDDRVGHELTRPVVRHLAPALDALDGDAAGRQLVLGGEDVGWIRAAAEGQDRRMFEEEELVTDPFRRARVDEAALESMGLGIPDPPEPARVQRHAGVRSDEGGLHGRTIAGVREMAQGYRPAPPDRLAARFPRVR